MKRTWGIGLISAGLLAGSLAGVTAWGQGYTISARPGAVNYVEGTVSINGAAVRSKATGRTFLATDDSLSTEQGQAEILLTPGVFVRVGSNSAVKMVSPRLTDTEVEVTRGEAIVEVDELVKEDNLKILDDGSTVQIKKVGLYLFKTGDPATVRVFDGKASTEVNGKEVEIGKNHELVLADASKAQHFDPKNNEDDLYAWSKTRDQYVSAASYSSATAVQGLSASNSFAGFGGYYGPGWMWNSGFNSYAWLPGDGAYFSPFGFGYYSPGFVGYAPVVYAPLGGGYYTGKRPVAVPVNPTKPVQVTGGTGHPVVPGAGSFNGNWPVTFGSGASHVSGNALAMRGYSAGNVEGRGSAGSYAGRSSAASARSFGSSASSAGSHSSGGASGGGGRGK